MIKKKLMFKLKNITALILLSFVLTKFNSESKVFAMNNTFDCGDFSYTIISEEYSEVCVTKYNKNNLNVVIESKVNYNNQEYDVVAFERGLFKNKTTLQKIILPSNITFISNEMFYGCTNLQTIKDSNGNFLFEGGLLSLDTIGEKAFKNCFKLFEGKEVKINLSNLQIGFKAFENVKARFLYTFEDLT